MFGISVLALPPKKTSTTRCPGRSQRNGGSRSGRLCSGPFGQELKRVMGSGKLSWSSWKTNYNIRNMVKPKLYIKKTKSPQMGVWFTIPKWLIYRFMAWLPSSELGNTGCRWCSEDLRPIPLLVGEVENHIPWDQAWVSGIWGRVCLNMGRFHAISAHRLMAILRRENDHQICLMNRGILRNNALINYK